jgi:hypothetical protein
MSLVLMCLKRFGSASKMLAYYIKHTVLTTYQSVYKKIPHHSECGQVLVVHVINFNGLGNEPPRRQVCQERGKDKPPKSSNSGRLCLNLDKPPELGVGGLRCRNPLANRVGKMSTLNLS